MKRLLKMVLVLLALLLVLVALVLVLNLRGEDTLPANPQPRDGTADQIQRGAYLAQVGNCAGCHTVRGGEPYAGGLKLLTPFGAITASNLTPDNETGLGRWSPEHFWRALHNGRSRDGRLLYPAFPYPNYTRVNRADSDALYAYLRSVKPVNQPVPAHELEFPYNTQAALGVWRALYFSPSAPVADPERSAEWNRGANLVQGLGHCNACHSSRNLLGASASAFDLNGGLIPMQNWYAPSLTSPDQAGVSHWALADITALLKTGITATASVQGPMAEVVMRSTQHWSDADLQAAAVYLKALPATPPLKRVAPPVNPEVNAKGEALYQQHCAQCHGERGEGAPGAYPALAGNRAVLMEPPANLIRVVLEGGFAPATKANPRPYGMPPFEPVLDANELAAVLTHLRSNWGNQGTTVTTRDVERYRSSGTN